MGGVGSDAVGLQRTQELTQQQRVAGGGAVARRDEDVVGGVTQPLADEGRDPGVGQRTRLDHNSRRVVLDLRGNPGGLLEQAVKVADKFLVSGPIVATVGNSEGRDEKSAHAQDTEPNYPMALLISGSSASASE